MAPANYPGSAYGPGGEAGPPRGGLYPNTIPAPAPDQPPGATDAVPALCAALYALKGARKPATRALVPLAEAALAAAENAAGGNAYGPPAYTQSYREELAYEVRDATLGDAPSLRRSRANEAIAHAASAGEYLNLAETRDGPGYAEARAATRALAQALRAAGARGPGGFRNYPPVAYLFT